MRRSAEHPAGKLSPAPRQPSSSCRHPGGAAWVSTRLPFRRLASPPSIQRMNPTQCPNHSRYYFQDLRRVPLHAPSPGPFAAAPAPVYPLASRRTSPPSILARPKFDRYVATRFLAAADLHGHRPTVPTWPRALLRAVRSVAYPAPASLLLAHRAYHSVPTGRAQTCRYCSTRHIRSLLTASTSSLLHPPVPRPLSCETFRLEPATR